MEAFEQVTLKTTEECSNCKFLLKVESLAYRDSVNNDLLCPTCYVESKEKLDKSS